MLRLGPGPLAARVGPVLVREPQHRPRPGPARPRASPRCGRSTRGCPVRGRAAVLIHRSLARAALQAEARVDPKTGLFNSRHFGEQLEDELARAARFQRPLSVIMADLDLLRDINNTHGHLAGDAVLQRHRRHLQGAAAPLRRGGALRRRGVRDPAARDAAGEAFEIAERIRRARRGAAFASRRSSEPIRATISFGVAAFPATATTRRAAPRGRPGGLPRQAAGPKPRHRRLRRPMVAEATTKTPPARLVELPEDGQQQHAARCAEAGRPGPGAGDSGDAAARVEEAQPRAARPTELAGATLRHGRPPGRGARRTR